jgi:molecular chaperone HtpG
MNDYILFKDIDDKYLTLPELLVPVEEEKAEEGETDTEAKADEKAAEDESADEEYKDERKVVYYVTDKNQQSQYINLFREQGMNAVILDHNIDSSFITQLERRNDKYKFMRIDADVTDTLTEESATDELKDATETLKDVFTKALNNDKLAIQVQKLKNADTPAIITLSEEGRRMQDMMKMYSMGGMGMDASMFGGDYTLTLNYNHPLVQYILNNKDSENTHLFAEQIYDLAMISNQPLAPEAMTKFMKRSNDIMLLLAK